MSKEQKLEKARNFYVWLRSRDYSPREAVSMVIAGPLARVRRSTSQEFYTWAEQHEQSVA